MAEGQPVAAVTGAASGIGAAVATRLRSLGYLVAGLDRVTAPGCDLSAEADVADAAAVESAFLEVEDRLGPVQLLVTAAGHFEAIEPAELQAAQWRRMLAVHVGGTVNSIRAVVPGMHARERGAIVTVTSELAISGVGHAAHYAAAKGAIIGLTRSLGLELAPRGVYVNGVAPGPTDTPLVGAASRAPEYLETLPLGRLVMPDEIAAFVCFLAHADGAYVGQIVSPNAGAVI